MSEVARGWRNIGLAACISLAAMTAGAPATAMEAWAARSHAPPDLAPRSRVDGIPICSSGIRGPRMGTPRLDTTLDQRGWLSGYRLTAPGLADQVLLGRHATLHGPFGTRWVYGDAAGGRTRSRVLDTEQGCIEAVLDTRGLVFAVTMDDAGASIYHDLIDPATHRDLGVWRHDLVAPFAVERMMPGRPIGSPDQGWSHRLSWTADGALLSETCGQGLCGRRVTGGPPAGSSMVGSGLSSAVEAPTVEAPSVEPPTVESQPVPESEADVWPDDKVLRFRWADSFPPAWMRTGILAAAADVGSSRGSNAPSFAHDPDAPDTVRVTAQLTGSCSNALACATRDIPRYWVVRFRPHGYEFPWGTLRWCEAYATPPSGCFEIRRTAIHEFGHVIGLAHPTDAMQLGPLETVMHDIIPARPASGSSLHRFGACDVARLQRRYALRQSSASLAMCDRVVTDLDIRASSSDIGYLEPVTVTATLSITDRDAYDRLANDPLSGRDVVIQRRPAGGSPWTSYPASAGPSPGSYEVTFRPSYSSDFRAVFTRSTDDGVTNATSRVIDVVVSTCYRPPCPLTGPGQPHGGSIDAR